MKLYIETTVPNFLYADDAPEKQNATEVFFDWVKISPDKLHTSELVFSELEETPDLDLREKLLASLGSPECVVLPITPEAAGFAERLVAERVIPNRYRDDAVHAAMCVLHEMDVLVTWNIWLIQERLRRSI